MTEIVFEHLQGKTRVEAFQQVFEGLHAKVFVLCRNLTGSKAEAEDAVQETFFAVYRALPNFRGEAQLSTWVYRIALNAALRVKARAKRTEAEPLDDARQVADRAPALDDAFAAREDTHRLGRALETLSVEHRAVLSLFAIEGLSHEEIASVLGVPTGTVWSRLHAARKKMAVALKES